MACQIVFLNEHERDFSLLKQLDETEIRVVEVATEQQLTKHVGNTSFDAMVVLTNRHSTYKTFHVEDWPRLFGCRIVALTSEKDLDFHAQLLNDWADDVIVLDPHLLTLKAKCQAFSRRKKFNEMRLTKKHFAPHLCIDFHLQDVLKDGVPLNLPKKEFQIIKLLAENPEKVFSKDEIYFAVWGSHDYDDANLLNVHIRRIRNRIEKDPNQPKHLLTRWGIGYQLIALN